MVKYLRGVVVVVAIREDVLEIKKEEIGAHSIRSGGAMAMYLTIAFHCSPAMNKLQYNIIRVQQVSNCPIFCPCQKFLVTISQLPLCQQYFTHTEAVSMSAGTCLQMSVFFALVDEVRGMANEAALC